MKDYNSDDAAKFFEDQMKYTVSCANLKRKMDNGDTDFVVIDVRHKDAYDSGRIPGAIFVDGDKLDQEWDKFSKDKLNILYCYGIFCYKAKPILAEAAKKGFRVAELWGNFDAWENYPFPVEK